MLHRIVLDEMAAKCPAEENVESYMGVEFLARCQLRQLLDDVMPGDVGQTLVLEAVAVEEPGAVSVGASLELGLFVFEEVFDGGIVGRCLVGAKVAKLLLCE